jgi:hypothetical protein
MGRHLAGARLFAQCREKHLGAVQPALRDHIDGAIENGADIVWMPRAGNILLRHIVHPNAIRLL